MIVNVTTSRFDVEAELRDLLDKYLRGLVDIQITTMRSELHLSSMKCTSVSLSVLLVVPD